MIPQRLLIVIAVLVVIGVVARSWWKYGEARLIAESWLREHHYRVLKLGLGGFSFFRFAPRLFRNDDSAFAFRAFVEDKQLGGAGIVWLRVWTDRLGMIEREPEISWERRPIPLEIAPAQPEEQWEQAQRVLLRHIARGTTSFTAPRREAPDAMPFDELIEHLLAMQNRGLIACSAPVESRKPGARYELIEFVELTDAGRAYLDSIPY
jgi:hypothetical protein